jgi:hypothetical protein
MPVQRIILFSLLFLLSFGAFAQVTDEAVKEKRERELKLLEQILTDAKNLRLPENRALVFARVANAYWPTDEKLARKLFQDAVADLIAAQTEVLAEKNNKQYFQALIYGQSPRLDIINLIGTRDAELALEYLAKSRPAAINEAMQNPKENSTSASQQFARAEVAAEQRLIGLAAEQNPQLAVKRVRESMKKDVSYETLNLLKKIYNKDPATADKLAGELFESFLNVDFSKNQQTSDAVSYFVNDFGRPLGEGEKAIRVSEDLLRRLVLKMTNDWLGAGNNQPYGYWNCMTVIERLYPERAAQIKKKVDKLNSQYQNEESQEYSKLVSGETPPEEMIARAEKFQDSYRNEIYRAAANKFANNGDVAQAEKILQTNISDDQSEYYLVQLYVNLANQLASQGKFEEANNYIDRISDDYQRVTALINLANSAYLKNPKENQKLAEAILNQARGLISDTPETHLEINSIGYLATAYAPLNPDTSFRLVESLLPTLNELLQANFVLLKFRNYGGLRQGEFQMSNGGNNLGIYNMEQTLRQLKDKDFDRTLQFANGINRLDTRIWFQLQLIDENGQAMNLPISGRYRGKIDR